MVSLFDLFITFAGVGAVTFGGGIAMLPILEREIVERKGWCTSEELTDYFAIGQCTPGIIAVNTATFVGAKHRGRIGGVIATLGMIFPSLVIIIAIAALLSGFAELNAVKNAFSGIRVCVCVLILNAAIKIGKKAVVDGATFVIFLAVFALSVFTDISPVFPVIGAAAAGLIVKGIKEKRK